MYTINFAKNFITCVMLKYYLKLFVQPLRSQFVIYYYNLNKLDTKNYVIEIDSMSNDGVL